MQEKTVKVSVFRIEEDLAEHLRDVRGESDSMSPESDQNIRQRWVEVRTRRSLREVPVVDLAEVSNTARTSVVWFDIEFIMRDDVIGCSANHQVQLRLP